MSWRLWIEGWRAGRRGLATLAVGLAAGVVGLGVSLPATAQISGTKHNLGTNGTSGNNRLTAGTAEICVFCHTPHGADTSAAVPLWNRTLALPASYTTYDTLGTSSLDGKTAPVGSVSIACLSCHDGQTAMSTVINAPGSGTAWSVAPAWEGSRQTAGKISAGLITNIGQDLRNDHPVGIQYGGGGITSSLPTGTTATTSGTRDADFVKPATAELNGSRVWWVDTEATPNGTRQKTDMMLYTRTVASAANAPEPFVECASCHDPHTTNTTFLRISNDSSAVCLACHIK